MKNVAVIGLGRFGSKIAVTLSQKGFDVIGLDDNEDIVSDVKDLIDQAVVLDSTDEKAMRAVHVDTVDIAVVAIGKDSNNAPIKINNTNPKINNWAGCTRSTIITSLKWPKRPTNTTPKIIWTKLYISINGTAL